MMRQLKINKSITVRTEESLDKYLTEISRIKSITTEEEVRLAQAIHAGGKKGDKAKDKLVTANLRFVVSVAKQYQKQGLPLSDLINEGNVGLITAAERYDETRGFKFISYAIWWIRQSIMSAIAEYSSTIRRPQSQIGVSNRIKSATNAFLQQNQRNPTDEELSEITDIELRRIVKAQQSEAHMTSMDEPVSDESSSITMGDMMSSGDSTDKELDSESLQTDLMAVLKAVLCERERDIIIKSFGVGCTECTLDEICLQHGLSKERVRQIRERALEKIRKSSKARVLLAHLCAA